MSRMPEGVSYKKAHARYLVLTEVKRLVNIKTLTARRDGKVLVLAWRDEPAELSLNTESITLAERYKAYNSYGE